MLNTSMINVKDTRIYLGNDLVMRSVRNAEDALLFSALSGSMNGQHEDEMCTHLLQHHPNRTYDDYIVVEDMRTQQIVSSTCLIPWQINLCGITLDVAMLEMVVTRPEYRRRGLVRSQIEYFHLRVAKRHWDLSIIQGIAYYYRQFGYAYALDHRPVDRLPVACIPQRSETTPYQRRAVMPADIPALTALHAQAISSHSLYVQRDDAFMRFLLAAPYYMAHIVENKHSRAVEAYAIVQPHAGQLDEIVEAAATTHAAAIALLQHLSKDSSSDVRVTGTMPSQLIQTARSLGSQPLVPYQWLLRVAYMPTLLTKLAPVFEQRLAASVHAGYTGELCINLFHAAYRMRFVTGQVAGIDDPGFVDASLGADGGELCIPPDAFTRLLFGYRTIEALRDAWPDIMWKDSSLELLNILFPVFTSCIWMPY